jgi:hypothetical protein
MVTFDGERFREHKANGLVKDVVTKEAMDVLRGNMGIGHVRYPTAGTSSAQEAQPFFVSSPLGIYLVRSSPPALCWVEKVEVRCTPLSREILAMRALPPAAVKQLYTLGADGGRKRRSTTATSQTRRRCAMS